MSTPLRSHRDVGRDEKLARAKSVLTNYQLLIRYANLNQKVSIIQHVSTGGQDLMLHAQVHTANEVLFRESSGRLRSRACDQELVRH